MWIMDILLIMGIICFTVFIFAMIYITREVVWSLALILIPIMMIAYFSDINEP